MTIPKAHLLLIDDDPNTLASLSRAFRLHGYEATVCSSAVRALELIRAQRFDLIFSDVVMPGKDGISMLEDLKAAGITTPVVMISGQANVETAVRATRLGAVDFLEKPLSTDKLLVTIENVLRLRHLEDENRELRSRLGKHEMIWSGPIMETLMAQVARVAASEARVAIQGETGTGKELIARAIHQKSARRDGPFVTLNCAAVPAELIESELFGHEKGSFTGAATRHVGKFEQASGGTLFLDEIGDMPLAMQSKLLRVLEEGEIERVGGDKPIQVDVRVVVATHRNLEEIVRQGSFRVDLFHRVNVFPISLPPLRERAEEIPRLAVHFAAQVASQNGWRPKHFSPESVEILQRYSWPGNVRELRNVVERVLLLSAGETITAEEAKLALPASRNGESAATVGSGPLSQRLEAFEREVLLAELRRNQHHMTNTARALGLERSHLYKKCQQLGIDLQSERK
ncbi:MAG TPA: sigma-54 dependent transcriptional regulator [Candidatus Saccharimonadales bacterium]|jgi:two-component system nitrogen regulation response regulator NtrX|nr:sigma-54 dependent transcriptional regulator [Candidatus Saccharimonadales bacterium]